MSNLHDYKVTQDLLTRAATVALQDWWEMGNRYGKNPADLIDYLSEPFHAITSMYGEQAAAAAVDYLILERSLDDELRWLPSPTPAERVSFKETQAALEWAINTSKKQGTFNSALARKKLHGATTRLTLKSGRQTILDATIRDGTRYARIPEPGACPFCLMLSSRGAVYTKDSVVMTKEMSSYHDHCRCIGIEAGKRGDPFDRLPPVNRELRDMWDSNVGIDGHPDLTSDEQRRQWRNVVIHRRRMKTRDMGPQADSSVRWPPIRGVTTPKYTPAARLTTFGKPEPLPNLEHMPGHVLFGWMENRQLPALTGEIADYGREAHTRGDQFGHRYGSKRVGATVFPRNWSDQKIVDSVRDTIADPDEYWKAGGKYGECRVRKEIDGVTIDVMWKRKKGEN